MIRHSRLSSPVSLAPRLIAARSHLLIAAAVALLGACSDPPRRALGASCSADGECASGLCAENVCLDPAADNDSDGLLNGVEATLGSNPLQADTDGDGVPDGAELTTGNANVDTDGDGKPDIVESRVADADHDCVTDQFDADDAVPAPDALAMRDIVCRLGGICEAAHDRLQVRCDVDGAHCDYADIAGFSEVESACDGRDENCDGHVDEGFPDLNDNGVADCDDPATPGDADHDGVLDGEDVCPGTRDPAQADADHNGIGDACATAYTLAFAVVPTHVVSHVPLGFEVHLVPSADVAGAPLPRMNLRATAELEAPDGSPFPLGPGATQPFNVVGVATFAGLVPVAPDATEAHLVVSAPGFADLTAGPFCPQLAVAVLPPTAGLSATADVPFALDVEVRDCDATLAPVEGLQIDWSTNDPGATVPGPSTFTAADLGALHVAGFSLARAGTTRITANVGGTGVSDELELNVTAADVHHPATAFTFVDLPESVTAGDSTLVHLAAVDDNGNVDTDYIGSASLSGTGSGTIWDPKTVNFTAADHGVVSASVTFYIAGPQSVRADGDLAGSADVQVAPGPPAQITWVDAPAVVSLGVATKYDLAVADAIGNQTFVDTHVTVTTADPPTVITPASVPIVQGLGTVTITLNTARSHILHADAGGGIVGDYTVKVTDPNTPEPPLHLVWSGAPAGKGFVGQPIRTLDGSPLEVALADDQGLIRADVAPRTITLALDQNQPRAWLGGTLTATTVNGRATFADLSVDRPTPNANELGATDGEYRLTASAPMLTVSTSPTFRRTYQSPTVSNVVLHIADGGPAQGPPASCTVVTYDLAQPENRPVDVRLFWRFADLDPETIGVCGAANWSPVTIAGARDDDDASPDRPPIRGTAQVPTAPTPGAAAHLWNMAHDVGPFLGRPVVVCVEARLGGFIGRAESPPTGLATAWDATAVNDASQPSATSGSAVGDFDGDGRPDLAVVLVNDDAVAVYWDGASPPQVFRADAHLAGYAIAAAGDVDRNGVDDLIVAAAAVDNAPTATHAWILPFSGGANPAMGAAQAVDGPGPGPCASVEGGGVRGIAVATLSTPERATRDILFACGEDGVRIATWSANGWATNTGAPDIAAPIPTEIQPRGAFSVADLGGDATPEVVVGMRQGTVVFTRRGAAWSAIDKVGHSDGLLGPVTATDVVLADVDGDGQRDLVAAFATQEVVVYWGDVILDVNGLAHALGDPNAAGARAPTVFASSVLVRRLAIADLDLDGTLDIVGTNGAPSASIIAAHCDRHGCWQDPAHTNEVIPQDGIVSGTALLDADHDGTPEPTFTITDAATHHLRRAARRPLAVCDPGLDGVPFTLSESTPRAGDSFSDVDGDGRPDALALSVAGARLRYGAGNGDATTDGIDYAVPQPSQSALADLDHDGRLDVVYALFGTEPIHLWIVSDVFGAPGEPVDLGAFDPFFSIADIDNDRHADLIGFDGTDLVARRITTESGNPALGAEIFRAAYPSKAFFAPFDIDHDALGDIFYLQPAGGNQNICAIRSRLQWAHTDCITLPAQAIIKNIFDEPYRGNLAFFDLDPTAASPTLVLRSDGGRRDGRFDTPVDLGAPFAPCAFAAGSVQREIGNLNGTIPTPGGAPTLIVTCYEALHDMPHRWVALWSDTPTGFEPGPTFDVPSTPFTTFDSNGDQAQDLVLQSGDGGSFVYQSLAAPPHQTQAFVASTTAETTTSIFADLDGDGADEVLTVVANGSSPGLWIGGTPTSRLAATLGFITLDPGYEQLATGDFDGDGWVDIAVHNPTTNTSITLRQTGLRGSDVATVGTFEPPPRATPVAWPRQAGLVRGYDIDGDGRADLVATAAGAGPQDPAGVQAQLAPAGAASVPLVLTGIVTNVRGLAFGHFAGPNGRGTIAVLGTCNAGTDTCVAIAGVDTSGSQPALVLVAGPFTLANQGATSLGVADADHDGLDDLWVLGASPDGVADAPLALWLQRPSGDYIASTRSVPAALGGRAFALANLTRDSSAPSLVVADSAGVLQVLLDGQGAARTQQTTLGWSRLRPAPYKVGNAYAGGRGAGAVSDDGRAYFAPPR